MKYSELVKLVAKESGYGVEDSLVFFKVFSTIIKDALMRDGEVDIVNVGRIYLYKRKAKALGYNKEKIVPAGYTVKFIPSVRLKKLSVMKEVINDEKETTATNTTEPTEPTT